MGHCEVIAQAAQYNWYTDQRWHMTTVTVKQVKVHTPYNNGLVYNPKLNFKITVRSWTFRLQSKAKLFINNSKLNFMFTIQNWSFCLQFKDKLFVSNSKLRFPGINWWKSHILHIFRRHEASVVIHVLTRIVKGLSSVHSYHEHFVKKKCP